jgi:hypothetical protein
MTLAIESNKKKEKKKKTQTKRRIEEVILQSGIP